MKLFAVTLVLLIATAYSQIPQACLDDQVTGPVAETALQGIQQTGVCTGVVDINALSLTPENVCPLPDTPCRLALLSVLVACEGLTGNIATVCSIRTPPPATTAASIESCLQSDVVPPDILNDAVTGCQTENFNVTAELQMDISSVCKLRRDGFCRTTVSGILENCLRLSITDDYCFFASFVYPTPSPENEDCVNTASADNVDAITRDCGGSELMTIDQVISICNGNSCGQLLSRIYSHCEFDPVPGVCAQLPGGSVKAYAVPIVVLLSALMSVLF